MKMRARHILAVLGILSLEAWWIVRAVVGKVGL
jgi:hypothetical protein